MTRKLSEIVKELTKKNPDGSRLYTQDTLAEALGTNQPAISQMLAGRAWDDHFRIICKIIPIGMRHNLIEERDLLPRRGHDRQRDSSSPKAPKDKADSR